jgi:hypothetical protein
VLNAYGLSDLPRAKFPEPFRGYLAPDGTRRCVHLEEVVSDDSRFRRPPALSAAPGDIRRDNMRGSRSLDILASGDGRLVRDTKATGCGHTVVVTVAGHGSANCFRRHVSAPSARARIES